MLFALPLIAEGAVVFSDVGYDIPGADEGREWVEIKNDGAEPVDLTGWRFLEDGVRHKLVPMTDVSIPPGARAIIADSAETYLAEHPEYEGLLFDSSFSLKNTGETLILIDVAGETAASITYVPKPTPPKKAAPAAPEVRNPEPEAGVYVQSGPVPAEIPTNELSPEASLAAGATAPASFGILPWIAALIAVALVGIAVVFMSKPKENSGYAIIEEKS